MTGAQTDPVKVPEHVTASAVLLRLASLHFARAFDLGDPDRFVYYGVWSSLRCIATLMLERGGLELQPNELTLLASALTYCPDGADRDYIEGLSYLERVA
jgi:hypothetical protein